MEVGTRKLPTEPSYLLLDKISLDFENDSQFLEAWLTLIQREMR